MRDLPRACRRGDEGARRVRALQHRHRARAGPRRHGRRARPREDRDRQHLRDAVNAAAVAAQRAATTMISMFTPGAASFASTVARAGVLPGDTHASHTVFISDQVAMSVSQMLVRSSLLLSLPHLAR